MGTLLRLPNDNPRTASEARANVAPDAKPRASLTNTRPIPGTTLAWRGVGRVLVVTGPCGDRHLMHAEEARALAAWLMQRFPATATPALDHDSREAWRRLYHDARGVAARMEAENARLRAELDQARADLAEAENRAPTGLEERGA